MTHVMTGFVDDTTHWINNFDYALQGKYDIDQMYQDTQKTAQWWEQLLQATGGKLELQKCFYYPILWKFDTEGIPRLDNSDDTHNIYIISSETGQKEKIA